jgi:hypothetical protein
MASAIERALEKLDAILASAGYAPAAPAVKKPLAVRAGETAAALSPTSHQWLTLLLLNVLMCYNHTFILMSARRCQSRAPVSQLCVTVMSATNVVRAGEE